MRSIVLIGIAILLLIGVAQAGDWPMFGHDAAHTGATDEIVEPPLELLWKSSILSDSIPTVSGSMVYVGSGDGNVYSFDATSGNIKWKYMTGGAVYSSPAVSGGIIYTGSMDMNIYALEATTGTLKWKYTTGDIVDSSPTVSDGIVYVGSRDGNVYALDATSGSLKWKYTTGYPISTSPTVSNGQVYLVSRDANAYALDAVTGVLIWKYTISGYSGGSQEVSPAVSSGMVYVGAKDNNVYALHSSTGLLKWKYTIGDYISSPALSGGIVYLGSNDNNIYALDSTTGTLKWKYTTGDHVSSPALSGGIVYLGSNDRNIYALDATTGALKWKYIIGVYVSSPPVVSGGVVYIVSDAGIIYAFKQSKKDATPTLTVIPSPSPTQVPTLTTIPTEAFPPKSSESQDQTNWAMVAGTIFAIFLIGIIILLLYKLKERIPKSTTKMTPEAKTPQKYKISRFALIILLIIVVGAIGYTVYQKYSPLAELANCGNNCIDYKKVKVPQYETSVPDIKITNADSDKLIMDVPIIIRNPSAKDTETIKIDFDVSMEGKHLTNGTIPAYELPAKQNTTILIKDVVIKYEELEEVLEKIALKHGAEVVIGGKANISMTIDLLIYFPIKIFDINIYTFTIPIQIETEVPIDMLKQNEEAKKQIEEKVRGTIIEAQEKIKETLPTLPSGITPSPTKISNPPSPLSTVPVLQ